MTARRFSAVVMVVVLALVVGSVAPAFAQDVGHKLGRGLVNVGTGWIELPKGIRDGSQQENPFVGVTAGLFKGLGLGLLRTGVGALEVVTFPFPWPKDYAPVYEPEYVWD